MSVSVDTALERLIYTLDEVFGCVRNEYDNADPKSVVQIVSVIKDQIIGLSQEVSSTGVVFGLELCQLKNIGTTWAYADGPGLPSNITFGNPYWSASDNDDDWVVTRGSIYNGTKIVNIDPSEGYSYVYKFSVPSVLDDLENCIAIGAIFYRISTGAFEAWLLGQSSLTDPPRLIEKSGLNVDDIVSNALDQRRGDSDFVVANPTGRLLLGRFVLDINELPSGGVSDYIMYAQGERDLFPYLEGQPYYGSMLLAANLSADMYEALTTGFDSNMVEPVLHNIVNADAWGDDGFYVYWTTGGRSLPTNVKYYYNLLYDPDIP